MQTSKDSINYPDLLSTKISLGKVLCTPCRGIKCRHKQ